MIIQSSGRRRLYPAVLAVALVSSGAHSAGAGDNPFPALVGSWSGAGEARFDNGQSESMRCKGYYTADGAQGIGLAIRCANAAAKIDLRAKLTYSNGSVSGDWEERTYNASGTVAGKASAEKVMVTITGGGLTGSMAVAIGGSGHSVTINTQGTGLKGVVISLTRG